jgi:hypothetical protein
MKLASCDFEMGRKSGTHIVFETLVGTGGEASTWGRATGDFEKGTERRPH